MTERYMFDSYLFCCYGNKILYPPTKLVIVLLLMNGSKCSKNKQNVLKNTIWLIHDRIFFIKNTLKNVLKIIFNIEQFFCLYKFTFLLIKRIISLGIIVFSYFLFTLEIIGGVIFIWSVKT